MKKFRIRILAEDVAEIKGNVFLRKDGEPQADGFCLELSTYGKYLDFSNPISESNSYLNTIPAGQDQAIWRFKVPQSGHYQIKFHYNNPGFKMGGDRNLRDERNCRVMLDNDWLGWMIFSISGYNSKENEGKVQNRQTITGNLQWNMNYLNCYLTAGKHRIIVANEAPPGQAVFDGPNIDWLEIESFDENYLEKDVPVIDADYTFKHPGIFQDQNDLHYLRREVLNKNRVIISALDELLATKVLKNEQIPHQVASIDVGPYNNPNIGGAEWTSDCIAANDCALIWVLTGDKRYAEKAIVILNTWAQTLSTVSKGNDLMLRFSLVGIELINAAEIIRHSFNSDPDVNEAEKWQDLDISRFERFVKEKLLFKTISFYPQANGNWDGIITAFNFACGIFLNDADLLNRCLKQFLIGNVQSGSCLSMGALPNYLYKSGESQESNRDQVHARMGLTGLANTAHFANKQGMNLFDSYDRRLLTGVDYNARYQLGNDVPSKTFISDRGRGSKDISSLGYECLVSYYRNQPELVKRISEAASFCLAKGVKNEAGNDACYRGKLLYV